MNRAIVQSPDGVTLVGGGPVTRRDLALALRRAPGIVAVDGGADRVLAAGRLPLAVVGDFDSVSPDALSRLDPVLLHRIDEQETTDFDKALRSVEAPFLIGLGFSGARQDHGLAVLNALVRHPARACLLLGPEDVVFHAPPQLRLRMQPGDRISLFPFAPVAGRSRGLQWPIDGLDFRPDGRVGTSNRVTDARVELDFDGAGMLVLLPRRRLDAALRALVPEGSGRRGR